MQAGATLRRCRAVAFVFVIVAASMSGLQGSASAATQVVGYTECPGGEVTIAYYGIGFFDIYYGPPGSVQAHAQTSQSYYTYGYLKSFRPIVNWSVNASRLNANVPGDVRPDMTYAYCE